MGFVAIVGKPFPPFCFLARKKSIGPSHTYCTSDEKHLFPVGLVKNFCKAFWAFLRLLSQLFSKVYSGFLN